MPAFQSTSPPASSAVARAASGFLDEARDHVRALAFGAERLADLDVAVAGLGVRRGVCRS
jgi:hypothetical protein